MERLPPGIELRARMRGARHPLAQPPTASPSPTTMASTRHLPAASYTAVGFKTPGGALGTAGAPTSSSIPGRSFVTLTAVDESTVAHHAEPVLGALRGVGGASPRGYEARDDGVRHDEVQDDGARGDEARDDEARGDDARHHGSRSVT